MIRETLSDDNYDPSIFKSVYLFLREMETYFLVSQMLYVITSVLPLRFFRLFYENRSAWEKTFFSEKFQG